MGVSYLYTFMKNIEALRKVSISEEADRYKRNENKSPVIAVDGINLIYSLYSYHHIPWAYGGQLKEYMGHFECFIESFQREGIDLFFFFDGANVMFNIDGWIKRKRDTVKEVHEFFDKIENGLGVEKVETNANCLVLPKNILAITIFVLKQKGCKVKITLNECDRELALFGRENNCMGILATDTDFIIYDTVKIYSTKNMNLSEMSFYVYDKNKVQEKLMLKSSELPLFASLVGNDYTNSTDLNNNSYKKWFNQNDTVKRFCGIADYIRRLNLKIHNGRLFKNDITKISRDFFREEKMAMILQESLNFYHLRSEGNGLDSIMSGISDYKWRSIIKMLYKEFSCYSNYLDILIRHCYQDCISLQDFTLSDIPVAAKVLKPLRERWYGILLYEKPGLKKVTEWLIDGYESLAKPKEVSPQFPKVHHPGLISLIRGHNKEANWNLLGDTFNLNPGYLKNFPLDLLIPALSFRYLKDKVIIHKWEVNALILSAILVRYFNARQLRSIKLDQVKSRPIRLYNLVTCSFEVVLQISQVLAHLIPDELIYTGHSIRKFQFLYIFL
ncbi:unnamed protein product [Nezara viridula]|uniref:Constitutive coactivator of peroxisome proliferator-activated receptor gamma n=1 Tax=Nezara viridula TaxID=85310 RepID=A0A9P0HGM0_NEZVI|nr:unnamed protein product [Nezara viridula]